MAEYNWQKCLFHQILDHLVRMHCQCSLCCIDTRHWNSSRGCCSQAPSERFKYVRTLILSLFVIFNTFFLLSYSASIPYLTLVMSYWAFCPLPPWVAPTGSLFVFSVIWAQHWTGACKKVINVSSYFSSTRKMFSCFRFISSNFNNHFIAATIIWPPYLDLFEWIKTSGNRFRKYIKM